jgi:hypothetical protein
VLRATALNAPPPPLLYRNRMMGGGGMWFSGTCGPSDALNHMCTPSMHVPMDLQVQVLVPCPHPQTRWA